jgi:hypothetical protein
MSLCVEDELEFDDLILGEIDVFSFNFGRLLRVGEVCVAPIDMSISVLSGDDPAPNDMVQGVPGLDDASQVASVSLKGLVSGVRYCVAMECDTDQGRHLIIPGRVAVVAPCQVAA